jgi:hypothetical protein
VPVSNPPNAGAPQPRDGEAERKLAEKVAKRVYELWLEDVRRDKERRGKSSRR